MTFDAMRLSMILLVGSAVASTAPTLAIAQVMYAGGTRPAVSADGRTIAFSAAHAGTWDVYLVNVDGSGERRLTRSYLTNGEALI